MYLENLKTLLNPILLERISEIKLSSQYINKHEIEIAIYTPGDLAKDIIGTKGNTIRALTTIMNHISHFNENANIRISVINEENNG